MTTNVTSRLTALLTRTNVKTNDLPSLLTKLQTVIGDGADKLCVMADFDFTITKRWNDEEKSVGCPSTYDVIKRSNLIEKHLSDAMKALFLKYWPIETDPNMSVEDKTPFIVEWISSEMRLMREAGLTKDKLALMMETHGLVLRDRFEAFCTSMSKALIPFVISTAGLADVVEGALRGWNLLSENVAIIGNRFSWDPVDKSLLGVEGDVVHTQNKEHSMSEFFAKLDKDGKYNNNRGVAGDGSDDAASNIHRPRPNVILLGDSLGDARMTLNLEFVANVIKVGFLNAVNPASKLEAFLSTFDIVLVNDNSMDVPMTIVEMICEKVQ